MLMISAHVSFSKRNKVSLSVGFSPSVSFLLESRGGIFMHYPIGGSVGRGEMHTDM